MEEERERGQKRGRRKREREREREMEGERDIECVREKMGSNYKLHVLYIVCVIVVLILIMQNCLHSMMYETSSYHYKKCLLKGLADVWEV